MLLNVEKVLLLSGTEFFAGLPGDVLAELAPLCREREVGAGGEVFAQDQTDNAMYVVARGAVRIHRGERELAVLGPGEIFGEIAALDPERRSAAATASEDSLLLELDHETLQDFLVDHSELSWTIIRFLCRRLRSNLERPDEPCA
jgi:CRP-like cAMP-binding protein